MSNISGGAGFLIGTALGGPIVMGLGLIIGSVLGKSLSKEPEIIKVCDYEKI